jgi:hypothetical protein
VTGREDRRDEQGDQQEEDRQAQPTDAQLRSAHDDLLVPTISPIGSGYPGCVTDLPPETVDERADLLPEERAAGSADPQAQAEEILAESADRIEHPDPDASTQSGRRTSADTA